AVTRGRVGRCRTLKRAGSFMLTGPYLFEKDLKAIAAMIHVAPNTLGPVLSVNSLRDSRGAGINICSFSIFLVLVFL
ncbi:hypothetical protein, partial [Pseudopedobacter beijingensis]